MGRCPTQNHPFTGRPRPSGLERPGTGASVRLRFLDVCCDVGLVSPHPARWSLLAAQALVSPEDPPVLCGCLGSITALPLARTYFRRVAISAASLKNHSALTATYGGSLGLCGLNYRAPCRICSPFCAKVHSWMAGERVILRGATPQPSEFSVASDTAPDGLGLRFQV